MKLNGTIAIILRPTITPKLKKILKAILNAPKNRSYSFQFLKEDQDKLLHILNKNHQVTYIPQKELYKKSDFIITLGGDGSLIYICRNCDLKKSPPIMGVNLGHLGFIAQYSPREFLQELEEQFKSDYQIESANLFTVTVKRGKKTVFKNNFFNDVVLSKSNISRIFTVEASFNQDHIFNVSGDGIIVSSPHGSTAYSLAANGPILHPNVKAVLITPICPHGLTYRPVAIPDDKNINLKVIGRETNVILTVDGQITFEITPNDCITIKKDSRKIIKLLKNPNRTYFQSLKEKFFHGRGHRA